MSGLEMIQKLRAEPFNKETEHKLQSHTYIQAAMNGTLTLSQRRAFVREQYFIQLSDAISFGSLAGHKDFTPTSLTGISVPKQSTAFEQEQEQCEHEEVDLFQFLLGGEIYASSLLLSYAKAVGLDEDRLCSPDQCGYQLSAKSQAYAAYWARVALSKKRSAGAAAVAVNFPAWGDMCSRLHSALASNFKVYSYNGLDDEGLAFIKFFATPIEGLDQMAASIIEEEGASYDELVEHVRLLQEYEVMFWDGIFEK